MIKSAYFLLQSSWYYACEKKIVQNLKSYFKFEAKTEIERSLGLKYAQIGVMLIRWFTVFIVFLCWKSHLL